MIQNINVYFEIQLPLYFYTGRSNDILNKISLRLNITPLTRAITLSVIGNSKLKINYDKWKKM